MNQIVMNIPAVNTAIKIAAQKAYDESNPFSLQMLFNYMDDNELRELMNWTDDETSWKPKIYATDTIHFRIVADAMLRYYYCVFSSSNDGIEWEDSDGQPSYDEDPEFIEEREYWKKVSSDNSEPSYPYLEYEDPDELVAYEKFKANKEGRPRIFSRDVITK